MKHPFGGLLPTAIISIVLLLGIFGPISQADSFSWEADNVSGLFTDPNRWHGPDYPAHTRFPGAGDDASINRGQLTVTISGDQHTRELVTDQPTLQITGSYTVEQLSAYGSLLTITGGGQLNAKLWLMGAQAIIDGANAQVSTLQPLGSSPASELIARNGAQVTSDTLDKSRGALRVVVEGAGSLWRHNSPLTFMEIHLKSSGRAEVSAADFVYFNVEGGGAILNSSGLFKGHGRIAAGGRVESPEAIHPLSGGFTVIDGGTWAVENTFINDAADLTIQNGGLLSAKNLQPGEFSSITLIEGTNSRLAVDNLLNPSGTIQLKRGGSATSARAEFERGGLYAEEGGLLKVTGDISLNNGLNLTKGGLVKANSIYVADKRGRSGGMTVSGVNSFADLATDLVVGSLGEGQLRIDTGGEVKASTLNVGEEPGSLGRVDLSGPSSGTFSESMAIGVRGRGELSMSFGGKLRAGESAGGSPPPPSSSAAQADCQEEPVGGGGASFELIIGQETGSQGLATLSGLGTELDVFGDLIVGDKGSDTGRATGVLALSDGAVVHARGRYVTLGRNKGQGTLVLEGAASRIEGSATLEIGRHGDGTLRLLAGAKASAPSTILGCLTDSSGAIEVFGTGSDGQPSTYESLGSFTIGNRTTGRVDVAAGGSVKSFGQVVLGRFAGAGGAVTIANAASTWRHLDAAQTGPGTLVIGDQGQGRFTLIDNARFEARNIVIGKQGVSASHPAVGTLVLRNGGTIVGGGEFVSLGQEEFSQGTLLMDGPASRFEGIKTVNGASGATLEIGRHGAGFLILTNGASLNLPSVILASQPGSLATVRISKDSTFESDGSITIGGSSTGLVEVLAGGLMISSGDAVIARSERSHGTVTLRGRLARWRHTIGKNNQSAGNVKVGESSAGALKVQDGAQFQSASLALGTEKEGWGDVLVEGPSSRLQMTSLQIGSSQPEDDQALDSRLVFGGGTMTVANGAVIVVAPEQNPSVIGIVSPPNKSSQLHLQRGGQLSADRSVLELGGPGASVLRIESGALVDTASGIVGAGPGTADVHVEGSDGAFAVWALKAQDGTGDGLVIGGKGEGTLTIAGLALLRVPSSSPGIKIGTDQPGYVEVNGRGIGTRPTAFLSAGTASIELGNARPGSLTILGGGEVEAGNIQLNGPEGTLLTVKDENSKLTASKSIQVRAGSLVSVDAKATISAKGNLEVRKGSVSILGDGNFDVGPQPSIGVGGATLNRQGFGQLRLFGETGPGGAPTGTKALIVEQGTVSVSQTLMLRSTFLFDSDRPYIKFSFVTVQLLDGGITVGAPTPTARPNTVLVNAGGLVTGAGLILGPANVHVLIFRNGGMCDLLPYSLARNEANIKPNSFRDQPQNLQLLAPAAAASIRKAAALPSNTTNAAATLFIDGSYEQTAEGTLNVVVTGPLPLLDYGVLGVSGDVKLAGRLAINFLHGFAPKRGQLFDFVKFGSNSSPGFDRVEVTGLAPGFQYDLEQTPEGTLQLRALNDGIATSAPILAIQKAGDEITISWPVTLPALSLETTDRLPSSDWQAIGGTANRIAVKPTATMQFFRLRE